MTRDERQRLRMAERKAAGLCQVCGKNTPQPGKHRCDACAAYVRERTAKIRAKAVADGKCCQCFSRPVAEGCRSCRECLDRGKNREAAKRRAKGIKQRPIGQREVKVVEAKRRGRPKKAERVEKFRNYSWAMEPCPMMKLQSISLIPKGAA